jgi:asparagine N-glycosylation enzyme membrane subunit Stt3
MANVSSFSGALYFYTKKNPWTPEGYILAYDTLMSIDASGGDYGICMEEEYTDNSADFLVYLLSQGADASICFWGNGRFSAENNFDLFNSWTDHKKKYQTMTEETYKANRLKLLELMSDNDWYLQFDYTDEEGGTCFIVQQSVDITVVIDPSTGAPEFTRAVTTIANEDYTLDAYCRLVEEEETITMCGMFNEGVDALFNVLNIAEEDKQKFIEFLIEKEWHFKLPPYGYYDSLEEVNEKLIEEWKEYCNEHTKE